LTYLVVGTRGAAADRRVQPHAQAMEFGDSPACLTSKWVEYAHVDHRRTAGTTTMAWISTETSCAGCARAAAQDAGPATRSKP